MAALDDRSPTTNTFPALRILNLTGSSFEIGQIVSSIRSTSLREVEIVSSQPTFADVAALVKAIPWKQNASSLRRLELCHTTDWSTLQARDDPCYAAILDVFAPLADMHALEHLEIACWNRVLSISDAAVARMSRAWPRIQHLTIAHNVEAFEPADTATWAPYAPQVARPLFSALVQFAERCPALVYCEIFAADVSEAELAALEARAAARDRPRKASLRHFVPARGAHSKHLMLFDVDRLARALHTLIPSIHGVGRSESLSRTTGSDRTTERRPSRYWWSGDQWETDGFRLLERLYELSRQAESADA